MATLLAKGDLLSRLGASRIVAGSVIAAAVLNLFAFSPRFWTWSGLYGPDQFLRNQPEVHRAHFLLTQLDNPWQKIAGIENTSDVVIEWRLLFPVLAHYLRFPRCVFLSLPFIGCAYTLALVASLLARRLGDPWLVFGGTLLSASCSWFLVSTAWLGYQDSWLAFALILASFAASCRTLLAVALLAPWIDERFIIALPLIISVRTIMRSAPDSADLFREAAALAVGIAPYLLIRAVVESLHLRESSAVYWAHRELLAVTAGRFIAGAWHGLRAGWLAVVAFFVFGLPQVAARSRAVVVIGVSATFVASMLVAQDLSRSASVMLPVMIAGLMLGATAWPKAATYGIAFLCLADLLLPARHVLNIFQIPIESLPAEYAHWRQSPDLSDPGTLIAQGYAALRRQDSEGAVRWFAAALERDAGRQEARAMHGVMLCTVGNRPNEGLDEVKHALAVNARMLDEVLIKNPDLLEPRFVRAYIRQEEGHPTAAVADLREILRTAPDTWPLRQKTVELLQALDRGPPQP